MKTLALWTSLTLFVLIVVGALRTVFDRRFPFYQKFDDSTRQAYFVLAIAAGALLAWSVFDIRRLQSLEIAGVKATLGDLQQKVDTLSEQLEEFYRREKIEVFDNRNWNRVRKVGPAAEGGVILEVTLEQSPIPGSIEVFEGVLPIPEKDFQVEGNVLRFPAHTDKPDIGLTIKYHPRTLKQQTIEPGKPAR